jgi:hypothetical protein
MSDVNKYVNAYVDFAVGQCHENLNVILQLKTQLKLANDALLEKDVIISQQSQDKDDIINKLSQDLATNKSDNQEMVRLKDLARKWEDAHNAMVNKVSHLDTALTQISQMKTEIISRDETISQLRNELNILKNLSSKKVINTRTKKSLVFDNEESEPTMKQTTDDF